jgi:hypothetical protein
LSDRSATPQGDEELRFGVGKYSGLPPGVFSDPVQAERWVQGDRNTAGENHASKGHEKISTTGKHDRRRIEGT